MFFAVSIAVFLAVLTVVHTSEPLYRAEAEVLLGGPSVASETARLQSPAMARAVAARLPVADRTALAPREGLMPWPWTSDRSPGERASIPAIAERLRQNVAVAHTPETLSLTIGYSATDAAVAARVANAYVAAYTGTAGRGSGRVPGERIISSAITPASSTSLGWVSALLLGLVLGSLAGLAAALATELRFPGLTTGADVQTRLWVRHLGSVPALASSLPNARTVLDAVVDHPQSGFAESFRNVIRAARGAGAKPAQVIAVASSVAGDGATTVAMAMARTLGLGRQRVVLVDCDARRRVSRMFGVDESSAGLSDILAGHATIDDALFDDAVSGARILPEATPPASPLPVLTGPAMHTLVQQLRSRFDVVLVANGPVAAGTDVRALAEITDSVLLVARWRSTPDTIVSAVLERLRRHHAEVSGVVLNQVDMHRQVRYTDDEASVYQRQFSKYFS